MPSDPEDTVRLARRNDGRLTHQGKGAASPVRAVRCFPWTNPGGYVSLRDDEHVEVALVVDPGELDPASRALLEEELTQAAFVLRITRIVKVKEELEIRTWRVETDAGPRTFQTARDEWPRPLPGGGLLLRDAAGDLYLIPETAALDTNSRRVLWAFID
jgi:hypothetical protein